MPNPNEINYSLGTLIVLLLLFWFVCKCISNPLHPGKHINQQQPSIKSETMDGHRLLYGGTPINLDNQTNLTYMRLTDGVIQVPNSMTSVRRLSSESHNYDIVNDISENDNEFSTMHMKKKHLESMCNQPKSLTAQRMHQPVDHTDRISMPSY
jgi:hypothetical protein